MKLDPKARYAWWAPIVYVEFPGSGMWFFQPRSINLPWSKSGMQSFGEVTSRALAVELTYEQVLALLAAEKLGVNPDTVVKGFQSAKIKSEGESI